MLRKGLQLAQQILRLPENVPVSKAEVENIPHNVSGKSVRGTLTESAVYLAYGCTSLSYSAFMIPNEKPVFHEPLFAGLKNWRSFLTGYAEANRGSVPGGAGIVFSKNPWRMNMTGKAPFSWTSFGGTEILDLASAGIPLTWSDGQSSCYLLHNQAVDSLTDEELRELFSGGVLTDAQTAAKLNRRGLGDILKIETEEFSVLNGIDLLTDHRINGPYAGQSWYHYYTVRNPYPPLKLRVNNPEAEITGLYVLRNRETEIQGISSVITETCSGGRAAVLGYNPWTNLMNSGKRHQILRTADWLSRNTMPVFLETPCQAAVIPRVDQDGMLVSVLLLNASIDRSPELKLHLRNVKNRKIRWITPEGGTSDIQAEDSAGYDLSVTPGSLGPWSIGVIL